jgi:hypothetical protein
MSVARSHWFAVFLMIGAAAHGCERSEPDSYLGQLECGMTLEQVRRISEVQIKAVDKHRLGDYRANFGRNAVWLDFADGHLRSATAQTITGPTSARLSPKKDLCTGKLTYFVSVEWVAELQEPDVYLDGELAAEKATSGLVLEVSEGAHVIRLERAGIVPVERRIVLDEDSFGDQWIDIEDFERDHSAEPLAERPRTRS